MGALRERAIMLLLRWGLTICLLIVVTGVALVPRVQDHVGYILPWRLPGHVFYKSRRYDAGTYMSKSDLSRWNEWPLHPISLVFTLFGLPRLLLTSGQPGDQRFPTVVWLPNGEACYMDYALSGGP